MGLKAKCFYTIISSVARCIFKMQDVFLKLLYGPLSLCVAMIKL